MIEALPNLAHIECAHILFKTATFQAICARQVTLESVILRDCTFPLDETVTYNVKDVYVVAPAGLTGFAAENFNYAVASLLVPERLRCLRLTAPDMLKDLLPLIASKAEFSNVETIELTFPSDTEIHKLVPFLERCPALRRLTLYLDKPGSDIVKQEGEVVRASIAISEVEVHGIPAEQKDVVQGRLRIVFPRAGRVQIF
jgi:hypothetical protein